MAAKIKKPLRGINREFFTPSDLSLKKIEASIVELDALVSDYERRWGIDRLPYLVSQDTYLKYITQEERLDAAIRAGDADAVRKQASTMMRAFAALESEALERGHKELTAKWFECQAEDGRVVIVAPDFPTAHLAAKERPDCVIFAMPEVAALLCRDSLSGMVGKVKEAFPGAMIKNIGPKPLSEELNDEIPF